MTVADFSVDLLNSITTTSDYFTLINVLPCTTAWDGSDEHTFVFVAMCDYTRVAGLAVQAYCVCQQRIYMAAMQQLTNGLP